MQNTTVSQELIHAYLTTDYVVFQNGTLAVLKINQYSETLKQLHQNHNAKSSCFITAHNPGSKILQNDENIKLQTQLEADIKSLDLATYSGIAKATNGLWPEEASYFVLGISEVTAKKLGNKYQQNAIVFSDYNCIPKLILLR